MIFLLVLLAGFEKRANAESPLLGSVTAMDHLARLQQLGHDVLDDEGSPDEEDAAAPNVARNSGRPNAALYAVLAIWRLIQSQKGFLPTEEVQHSLLSGAPSLREHSWLDSVLALCVLGELCTSQLSLLAACMQLAGQPGVFIFNIYIIFFVLSFVSYPITQLLNSFIILCRQGLELICF